ncbi:class V lanthionine synthetase subunit LxmK [Streptosporangium sp. NPDC000396]|uniref:class V lanthionine synthetase subunit LxmK n=1 Tax=Streptosporangium sp. NPDC000396 TaxID=3366185 RepID=UPI00368F66B0
MPTQATHKSRAGHGRTSRGRNNFVPLDLSHVPAVEELLHRLNLGGFDRDSLQGALGRNDIWAGRTESGREVFVKRLIGAPEDAAARLRRTLAHERFVADAPAGVLRGPALLGYDEGAGVVVFDYLKGARSGAELMVDEIFDEDLSHAVGRAIGLLHGKPVSDPGAVDDSPFPWPSVDLLRGLPSSTFDNASFAELEAWRLLQTDDALIEAIEALLDRERSAEKVPSHCDLRVDQILLTENEFVVTDWEEFRLADPARDVGGFTGEWLYRAVLDIVTSRGDEHFHGATLTHEEVITRGIEKIERLRPRITAFWAGYRQARPWIDPGLAERAAAFAGWHMIDRLIAGAGQRSALSGIERAAAGIGRSLLITPHAFVSTIGLEDPE